ncbi:MAG: shikimate kinase [Oscillospiraceae bacterium]
MLYYGLVGKQLSHSFSKEIHSMLGSYFYDLFSVDESAFDEMFEKKMFGGLNITIPYKQRVIKFCDSLSETAKRIGSVNTVVNKDGKLFGYNTDYLGFNYMLKANGIDLSDKKILVLGSGGTSLTVCACAKDAGAKKVVVVSRKGKDNYDNISDHFNSDIIINTTPVGMFPENSATPVSLASFTNCCGVIDVIYNPLKTALLLEAKELNIPHCNGLLMLIAQAKFASELFFDKQISESQITEIYNILSKDLSNIVLTGMPACGKSSVGKIVATRLNRPFIDTDVVVEKEMGMTIPHIFEQFGESEFRRLEAIAVKSAGAKNGVVISTGGGSILSDENYDSLRQNGSIAFIERDLELLQCKGRPLSKNADAIKALYEHRIPIYKRCCDFKALNNDTVEKCANDIIKKFEEAIF